VLVTPWALVIGLMRYVFMVATWLLPWLTGALPTRYSAKVVAAVQGVVLVVASGQFLAPVMATALVVAALAALLWSFGKSVTWLWRARMIRPGAAAPHSIRRGAAAPHEVRGGRVGAGSVTARRGRVVAGSVTVHAVTMPTARPALRVALRPVRTPVR